MKDIIHSYLIKENTLCESMWSDSHDVYVDSDGKDYLIYQDHICDFEIASFMHRPAKERKKRVRLLCKQWLKSQGKKRDTYMCCCDDCPHLKYLTFDMDTGLLINVASLSIKNSEEENTNGNK